MNMKEVKDYNKWISFEEWKFQKKWYDERHLAWLKENIQTVKRYLTWKKN